jgi:hypothetical protein
MQGLICTKNLHWQTLSRIKVQNNRYLMFRIWFFIPDRFLGLLIIFIIFRMSSNCLMSLLTS